MMLFRRYKRPESGRLWLLLAGALRIYFLELMRGNWTSVRSMYLGRKMPLLFLLLSNPYSSKIELEDNKTILPFL